MSVAVLLGCLAAVAAEPLDGEVLSAGAPQPLASLDEARLLVIAYDSKARLDARRERFIEELGLVLDGFTVEVVRIDRPQFARGALPTQVKLVEPVLAERRALAAAWLAEPTPGWLMVYLVAVQTGQTLVRTVHSGAAASEAELALAVRELLGTAWLFTPPEQVGPAAMQLLVDEVREQVLSYGRRYRGGLAALAVRGDVGARMALSDEVGADSAIGFHGGVDNELLEGLWAGIGLTLATRPSRSTRIFHSITAWSLMPVLSAAYEVIAFDLRDGRLSLAPSASLGLEWEQFTFNLGEVDYSYGTTRLRLQAGLDLRWFFSRRVGVVLSPKVGWTTNRGVYRAQTTNDVIVATPRNDWGFSLGVLVRPWR